MAEVEVGKRLELLEIADSPKARKRPKGLGEFLASCERQAQLSRQDRLRIVEQALLLMEMNYVHLPFDAQNPDAHLIDNFIAAVTAPANQPAYVHCAAGGRAASLWMVKRVLADGWDEQRALTEANALGLNDRFRPFALNYIHSHGKK